MEYLYYFGNRIKQYRYAIETYPYVLENEFNTAIKNCDIKKDDVILNILAAGIPLKNWFTIKPKVYKEYEINENFHNFTDGEICKLDNIPESDNSIDTIISLTGLHHVNNEDQKAYFMECHRILKENGKFIIGDVIQNSKEANWLNIFVDKYNSNGHKGMFFTVSDKSRIEENGFKTEVKIEKYPWVFKNEVMIIDFVKNLFGLDLATNDEILYGVNEYLKPQKHCENLIINWSLIYFISTKN
jgi:SAM-dependent methyltransferase